MLPPLAVNLAWLVQDSRRAETECDCMLLASGLRSPWHIEGDLFPGLLRDCGAENLQFCLFDLRPRLATAFEESGIPRAPLYFRGLLPLQPSEEGHYLYSSTGRKGF